MTRIGAVLGIFVMCGICCLLSENRRKINWILVCKGMLLQMALAFLMLKTTVGLAVFGFLDKMVLKVLNCAGAGAEFVFSKALANSDFAGRIFGSEAAFIFAFQALPVIIFLSALVAMLYYCGIMQKVIYVFSLAMKKTLRISGAEACNTAANIFLGQTEAPLMVRPYIEKMTSSELFAVMVGGMATISGSTLATYVAMLKNYIPGIAGHMIAASIMSAPAAIVFSKIIYPETGMPVTMEKFTLRNDSADANIIDACSRGCVEGLHLALNVAAMLIGFLSVLALGNLIWGGMAGLCGWTECATLESLFGWIFSPFALLLGIPFDEMRYAGVMLSEKTILNEFVAYFHFATDLSKEEFVLSQRTRVIISYALCGFSNIGSIGIQIAGIGGMAPGRRKDLSKMALKALVAGSFASFCTAVIAGLMM